MKPLLSSEQHEPHGEMKFSDFKIGEYFYTATGRWLCTDIGTRVVVAKKANSKVLGPAEVEDVFDEFDQGGCSLEPWCSDMSEIQ